MITSGLLNKFDEECLSKYHDFDPSILSDEEDFIEYTKEKLDCNPVDYNSQSIETTVKSIHQSPRVDFPLPTGRKVTRELADLLFVYEANFPSKTIERTMISQSKFANSPPSWNIDLYQYHLITSLPPFMVTRPRTCKLFNLGVSERSFANFSMASNYKQPFYLRGERMEDGVSNSDYSTDSATFNPNRLSSDDEIYPIEYSKSILKRFLRGTYGIPKTTSPEVERLVDHLIDIVEDNHTTQPACPDGGADAINEKDDGLIYIKVKATYEESPKSLGLDSFSESETYNNEEETNYE